jgi:hypothetical protein
VAGSRGILFWWLLRIKTKFVTTNIFYIFFLDPGPVCVAVSSWPGWQKGRAGIHKRCSGFFSGLLSQNNFMYLPDFMTDLLKDTSHPITGTFHASIMHFPFISASSKALESSLHPFQSSI